MLNKRQSINDFTKDIHIFDLEFPTEDTHDNLNITNRTDLDHDFGVDMVQDDVYKQLQVTEDDPILILENIRKRFLRVNG